MTVKIGINGFGRIGRLVLRAGFDQTGFEFIQINDPAADAATAAHLVNFDSIHGRWQHEATAQTDSETHPQDHIKVAGKSIQWCQNKTIAETDWSNCDIVIEASGVMKTQALLKQYLEQGVQSVIVTAPVKEDGVLNVVMGVNDDLYDHELFPIVTAASCTTNCMAPVVKVIHEKLGIKHGSMTTIHDITNTQNVLDAPHKDLRRARASSMSLIPTTTGSATAITHISVSYTHLTLPTNREV